MIPYLLFFLLIYLLNCIKIVNESERVVVLRLGRFLKVTGPGLIMVLVPLDTCIKVNLHERIPDWQSLGTRGLEERVKQLVLETKGIASR